MENWSSYYNRCACKKNENWNVFVLLFTGYWWNRPEFRHILLHFKIAPKHCSFRLKNWLQHDFLHKPFIELCTCKYVCGVWIFQHNDDNLLAGFSHENYFLQKQNGAFIPSKTIWIDENSNFLCFKIGF